MEKSTISNNQFPKKVIKKFKSLHGKFKKILGIGALAASIAIGNSFISSKDSYYIGIVSDLPNDAFENGIPIYKSLDSSQLVTVLNDGTLIITHDNIKEDKNIRIKASCLNNKNEKITGYIPKEYVQNSVNVDSDYALYKVNSEKGVNLRNTPNISDNNKISALPNGTIVLGKSKNNEWSKIIHITKTSLQEGYSASQFLAPYSAEIKQELEKSFSNEENIKNSNAKEIPNIKYNVQNGNVFGIDICDLPPKMFEKLLTGNLPIKETIQTTRFPKVDLGKYPNRKPNFVYLKLAASGYRSNQLKQGSPTPFKQMSEICEKLGVPYGFYYYSTCTNEQEAQMEYNWIIENMDKLEKTQYNLLPLALDVEIADDKDRQFMVSREQLTNSKIKLANMVEQKYGKTILYSAMNTLETILDIEQYQKGLNSGNSAVWLVTPSKRFLKHPQVMAEYEKVKEHVVGEQIVLDAFIVPPKRVIVSPHIEATQNKKEDKKPTIKGAKTAKLTKTPNKEKNNGKDKDKDKPSKKIKGKDKNTANNKLKNKKEDKQIIPTNVNPINTKDKQKEVKNLKNKPTTIPQVIKYRDYLIDINIFDAKIFEMFINEEYKKLSLEYTKQNYSKLVTENEIDR